MHEQLFVRNDTVKLIHEAFVSNNTGTTPCEMIACLFPWFISSFILQLLHAWGFLRPSIITFLVEFKFSVIPQLIMLTVGSEYLYPVVIISIIFLIGVISLRIVIIRYRGCNWPANIWDTLVTNPDSIQYCFLDNYRGHLCILTCTTILAVDFQIFPRRLAKTEYYGYGCLDVGVGCFMIVNGFLAPETKKKYKAKGLDLLKKSLASSIPLLVLGLLRVVAVKSLNYQEHVSEYGVHWNFFFSLAAAKIVSSVVFLVVPPFASGVAAIVLTVSYQTLLQLGLRDMVFYGIDGTDSRSSFIDANREGLCASVGFTCLYLAGVQQGYVAFRTGPTLRDWLRAVGGLIMSITTFMLLTVLSNHFIEPPSRRLINMTYTFWLVMYAQTVLLFWVLADLIIVLLQFFEGRHQDKYYTLKPGFINKSMSYNFLLCFIIANVLTGFVNLNMDTIFAEDTTAMIVMTSYLFTVLAVICMLYRKKYQFKFW